MKRSNISEILGHTVLVVLCLACFPANPLVFTGIIQTEFYLPLFLVGCAVWAVGMVLVMAPIIQFPRRGGVPKGKSFVHTTKLVDKGIYAVVRHPQYLGGILAIFLTTLLWYPHWLFAILGVIGAIVLYFGAKEEDKRLVQQFGDEYRSYMKRVSRMNLLLGIVRLWRR